MLLFILLSICPGYIEGAVKSSEMTEADWTCSKGALGGASVVCVFVCLFVCFLCICLFKFNARS